jgi:outer membrane protein assembly factor BamA
MAKLSQETLDDLKSNLKIQADSPAELDDELISQSHIYGHVGVLFAMASARRDKKKNDLEVLEASLNRDIRDQLTTDGEKVTDDKVKAMIKLEQTHQRAMSEYLDARFLADKFEAIKEAYKQRAYMLREVATLRATDYFGEIVGSSERRNATERSFRKRYNKDE